MSHSDDAKLDQTTLPSLPRGWAWGIPHQFCSVVASGSTPTADRMFDGYGDVPFIKVYNLTHHGELNFSVRPTFIACETHASQLKRSITRPGDVLINIVGPPLGKVSLVPDEFPEWNINQAIVVFRPREGVFNRYLCFALLTDTVMKRVTRLAKATAGQFNIGVNMCRHQLPIPIAPLNEQRRIVGKVEELFSDLDAGVAALERARANLKRYRASVLKAAVEGALTADWRAAQSASTSTPDSPTAPVEPASKLLTRILTARRQQWESAQLAKYESAGKKPPKNWKARYKEPAPPETSDLPELPKTWCWASVEQVADSGAYSLAIGPFGSNLKVSDYRDNGVPLVFVRNIRSRMFGGERAKFVSLEKATELDAHSAVGGDILITKMGDPPGDACLYPEGMPKAIITADCIKLRLHPVLTATSFFVNSINSQPFRVQILGITKGVAQQKVSLSRFSKLAFPVPPLAEQAEIVARVAEKLSQIEAAESAIDRSLRRAARLRQSILKQAFEGKLVPQDPTDEPASQLLARIQREQEAAAPKKAKQRKKVTRRKRATKSPPSQPVSSTKGPSQ